MNDELDKLSDSVKKLRMEYEKYFMGLEKMEPLKARDEVKKNLRRLMGEASNKSTARRFRLQSLQASLITYESHWNRIARQIEEGTFKRDKLRAQALLEEDNPPASEESPQAAASNPAAAAAAAAAAKPGATAAKPAATAASASKPAEYPDSIRKLYDAFESTRVQLGGDAKPISIAALAATVQKQSAAIQAQYNCKTVEFKVAVKDGRPILKAVPK